MPHEGTSENILVAAIVADAIGLDDRSGHLTEVVRSHRCREHRVDQKLSHLLADGYKVTVRNRTVNGQHSCQGVIERPSENAREGVHFGRELSGGGARRQLEGVLVKKLIDGIPQAI